MTNNANAESAKTDTDNKLPTHIAKIRHGHGKQASYERIGAAWENEKGAIYVKFYGTQIVSDFTLFAVK